MKFAEHLTSHITPEWRTQYIEYEKMKAMLYEAQEAMPTDDDTDESAIESYLAKFHERFFKFCEQQLRKINIFFSEKLAEAMRKLATLKADIEQHKERVSHDNDHQLKKPRKKIAFGTKTHRDLELAFSEFYLNAILLQSYQDLNFTGFRKILKKHDKLFETASGAEWRQSFVETSLFFTNKDIASIIEQVENVVINELEGGDRSKAMKRLRVPPRGEKQNPLTTFLVGNFFGLFIMTIFFNIYSAYMIYVEAHYLDLYNKCSQLSPVLSMLTALYKLKSVNAFYNQLSLPCSIYLDYIIRLYRGPMLIILFVALLGLNTYMWRTNGVNHVLIFEVDPRDYSKELDYLKVAAQLASCWGLSLMFFITSEHLIPPLLLPLLVYVPMLVLLLNPSRKWLLVVLGKMMTAMLHHVTFAQFWMADQLNSLTRVLLDVGYTVCFYSKDMERSSSNHETGLYFSSNCQDDLLHCKPVDWCKEDDKMKYVVVPILSVIPALIRFLQCWRRYKDTKHIFPHVINAIKYSTTFFVVLFATLVTYSKSVKREANEKYESHQDVFFWLWVLSALVSSCYTFTWDIKMDWGLMDKNAGENRYLREETVYRYKAFYYFIMIFDVIMRFSWIITTILTESMAVEGSNEIFITITSVLELSRRILWNFLRLENEHLNNCGEFRAVRDISITPIDHSDQVLLLKMMDEEDGVVNRREQTGRRKPSAKRRDVLKSWPINGDDDEETDSSTWMAFKGGITSWLPNRKQSVDRASNNTTNSSVKRKDV